MLWAAIWNQTDGYTYSSEDVLGIYSTQGLAEARCSLHAKENRNLEINEYETREVIVDQDW